MGIETFGRRVRRAATATVAVGAVALSSAPAASAAIAAPRSSRVNASAPVSGLATVDNSCVPFQPGDPRLEEWAVDRYMDRASGVPFGVHENKGIVTKSYYLDRYTTCRLNDWLMKHDTSATIEDFVYYVFGGTPDAAQGAAQRFTFRDNPDAQLALSKYKYASVAGALIGAVAWQIGTYYDDFRSEVAKAAHDNGCLKLTASRGLGMPLPGEWAMSATSANNSNCLAAER